MKSAREQENPVISRLLEERKSVATRFHSTGNWGKRCALGKELNVIDKQIEELRASKQSPIDLQITALEKKLITLNTRREVSGNFGTRNSISDEYDGVTEQIKGLKAQKSATTNDELVGALVRQIAGLKKQKEALNSQSQFTGNFHENISLGQLATLAADQVTALQASIDVIKPSMFIKAKD